MHKIVGLTLQMKIFSIIHIFLGCFLPSDMPQLSSAKSLRDSHCQNDDDSITKHAYYGYITTLYGRRGRGGGGPLGLKHENVHHVGDFISTPPLSIHGQEQGKRKKEQLW